MPKFPARKFNDLAAAREINGGAAVILHHQ
jgi:hypothetical protein